MLSSRVSCEPTSKHGSKNTPGQSQAAVTEGERDEEVGDGEGCQRSEPTGGQGSIPDKD